MYYVRIWEWDQTLRNSLPWNSSQLFNWEEFQERDFHSQGYERDWVWNIGSERGMFLLKGGCEISRDRVLLDRARFPTLKTSISGRSWRKRKRSTWKASELNTVLVLVTAIFVNWFLQFRHGEQMRKGKKLKPLWIRRDGPSEKSRDENRN